MDLDREAIKLTAMLAATEDWAPLYSKTPQQHADLVNAEAELQVILTKLFRDMQKRVQTFVNWDHYNYQLTLDYNVDVIVNDDQIDSNDGTLMKISVNTIRKAVEAGFTATEAYSQVATGIQSTAGLIEKLSTKQVAMLVGKKVEDDGTIIDNPNAEYNVLDTVRNDIAESVKTSLGLGESTEEAIVRMRSIIKPIDRARLIAQTESVNAYQAGVTQFGVLSGAVGKAWQDAGAIDICRTNTQAGPIPFNQEYPGGVMQPTQHPRCRCGQRLIYAEEWAAIQSGNPYVVTTGITPKPTH